MRIVQVALSTSWCKTKVCMKLQCNFVYCHIWRHITSLSCRGCHNQVLTNHLRWQYSNTLLLYCFLFCRNLGIVFCVLFLCLSSHINVSLSTRSRHTSVASLLLNFYFCVMFAFTMKTCRLAYINPFYSFRFDWLLPQKNWCLQSRCSVKVPGWIYQLCAEKIGRPTSDI